MELREILFIVVFAGWIPLGVLVTYWLGKPAQHADEAEASACEERRVREPWRSGGVVLPTAPAQGIDPIAHMDGAPVRHRDRERGR